MSNFYPNSYQTPNAIIDDLLASGIIDPYEFTLLSVIIRKTRGWHKSEEEIALSRFEEWIPVMSRSTIIRKLQSLQDKGLIDILQRTKNNEKITNKYRLSSSFSPKGGSVTDTLPSVTQTLPSVTDTLPGSVTDTLPSVTQTLPSVTDTLPGSVTDTPGGSVTVTHIKNNVLKTQNSKQQQNQNDAVVSGDESPGAAIAALKNNGIEAAKAAELVTLHGPERCLSEVDKAEFAAQKGAVRESVAAWIIGSLATPNGFSTPKGYQPPAERAKAEAAAAKRAEIARKKREAEESAEQLRREQFHDLLAIYNDFPESEQRKIAERVINDFANKGEFQKFRIESWRKDGSTNFLIFKHRKAMFRDEFVAVMLENEQEKAG